MLTTTTSRYVKFLYQTIALFRSSYKEDGKIINEFKLLEVSTPEVININENYRTQVFGHQPRDRESFDP